MARKSRSDELWELFEKNLRYPKVIKLGSAQLVAKYDRHNDAFNWVTSGREPVGVYGRLGGGYEAVFGNQRFYVRDGNFEAREFGKTPMEAARRLEKRLRKECTRLHDLVGVE